MDQRLEKFLKWFDATDSDPPRGACSLEAVFVVAILFASFLFLFLGSAQMGIAFDELFHIPAGYTLVESGEKRIILDHPPLGHLLAGVFLEPLEPVYSRAEYFSESVAQRTFQFGQLFFRQNEPRLQSILLVARLPFLLTNLVGSLYCYLLGRSLFGKSAGLLALTLSAFCPLLLGWSRYVYLDGLLATTLLAAVSHLIWFLRKGGAAHFVGLVIASGLTLTAKFSGLLLVVVAVPCLLAPRKWFALEAEGSRLGRPFSSLLIWGGTTALLVWAIFGFPRSFDFYFEGFRSIYSAANPGYEGQLFGHFAREIWYFYPVLFATKATLPALLLLVLLVVQCVRWSVNPERRREVLPIVVLVVTSIGFLGLTSLKSLPIGARYLLPVLPPLYVAMGALVTHDGLLAGRMRGVAAFLALWHASTTVRIFPDEMAYFNEAFGGPAHGIFIANDASLDAGQNLPRLARYLASRGNPRVKLLYQGTDVPARWGIVSQTISQKEWDSGPEQGIYVVSSYPLVYGQREHQKRPEHRDWLATLKPTAVIGHSLFVYETTSVDKK